MDLPERWRGIRGITKWTFYYLHASGTSEFLPFCPCVTAPSFEVPGRWASIKRGPLSGEDLDLGFCTLHLRLPIPFYLLVKARTLACLLTALSEGKLCSPIDMCILPVTIIGVP
jgi:hypothetical protein